MSLKRLWLNYFNRWRQLVVAPAFAKLYALFSLGLLLFTVCWWSFWDAKIQLNNADQLINPFLFNNGSTLHKATFVGSHSFLLKWPLFWLLKYLGFSSLGYISLTVVLTVAVVLFLAVIFYWLNKNLLVFGSLCLALASVLLLVPPTPYAGGLLPVNMAMLTTRNIEYVVYILSVGLFIKFPRIRSFGFWLATIFLALVMASDRLFLTLSLGGAALGLIYYAFTNRWRLANLMVKWLVMSGFAAAISYIALGLINLTKITHISNQNTVSPYMSVANLHSLATSAIYMVMGLLTNFGANPAYQATIIKNIPSSVTHGLFSESGLGYLINLGLLIIGLVFAFRLVKEHLGQNKNSKKELTFWSKLTHMLIWSSIIAFAAFIFTAHYYAVDARYLSVSLFALFITAATYLRSRTYSSAKLVLFGLVLSIGIIFGIFSAWHTYNLNRIALADINNRNLKIAQVLDQRHVDALVGDYWRVVPIKQLADDATDKQTVTPLDSCFRYRDELSSSDWQLDLTKHSFAYLISFDKSLTNYPSCSLTQVLSIYGRPNASVNIAGNYNHPVEQLLFYEHGINSSPTQHLMASNQPSTVEPINITDLTNTTCQVPTSINIVAHQDDDLLFMNPDILHDIAAGFCVRTVYLTAGDAGNASFYWFGRQQGSEAAYASMLGINNLWVQRIVKINNNEYVTIANPRGDAKHSLIFMNLPDGGLKGTGFKNNNYQSLAKLYQGSIQTINSVDGESSYTASQLVSSLNVLMHTYQPTEVRTQADYVSKTYPDHSDHNTVGEFTQQAQDEYETEQYNNQVTIPIKFYIGYPIRQMPANIFGSDLTAKEAAFMAYAKFDPGVCYSLSSCQSSPTYGSYLARQYEQSN